MPVLRSNRRRAGWLQCGGRAALTVPRALVATFAVRFRQCNLRALDAGYSSQILVPRLLGLPPLPQGGAPSPLPQGGAPSPLPQSGAGYDGGGGVDDALRLTDGGIGDFCTYDGTAAL